MFYVFLFLFKVNMYFCSSKYGKKQYHYLLSFFSNILIFFLRKDKKLLKYYEIMLSSLDQLKNNNASINDFFSCTTKKASGSICCAIVNNVVNDSKENFMKVKQFTFDCMASSITELVTDLLNVIEVIDNLLYKVEFSCVRIEKQLQNGNDYNSFPFTPNTDDKKNVCSQPLFRKKYWHKISSTFPTTSVNAIFNFTGNKLPSTNAFTTEFHLSMSDVIEDNKEKIQFDSSNYSLKNCSIFESSLSNRLLSQCNTEKDDLLNCNISTITSSQSFESENIFDQDDAYSSFARYISPNQKVPNISLQSLKVPVNKCKVNDVYEIKNHFLIHSKAEIESECAVSAVKNDSLLKANTSVKNTSIEKQKLVSLELSQEICKNVSLFYDSSEFSKNKISDFNSNINIDSLSQELIKNKIVSIRDSSHSSLLMLDKTLEIDQKNEKEIFFTSTPVVPQELSLNEKHSPNGNSFLLLKRSTLSTSSFESNSKTIKSNESWYKFVNSNVLNSHKNTVKSLTKKTAFKESHCICNDLEKNISCPEIFESCDSSSILAPSAKSINKSACIVVSHSQNNVFGDSYLAANLGNVEKVPESERSTLKASFATDDVEKNTNEALSISISTDKKSDLNTQVLINTASGQLIVRCPTLETVQEKKTIQWKPFPWKQNCSEKENKGLQSVPEINETSNLTRAISKLDVNLITSLCCQNIGKRFCTGVYNAPINYETTCTFNTHYYKPYDVTLPPLQRNNDNLLPFQSDNEKMQSMQCDRINLLDGGDNNLLPNQCIDDAETHAVPQIVNCQSNTLIHKCQSEVANDQKVPNSRECFFSNREEDLYEDKDGSDNSTDEGHLNQNQRKKIRLDDELFNCDDSLTRKNSGRIETASKSNYIECVEKLYPLQPLKTCRRPLRIGLSKRRKIAPLHHDHLS